MIGCIVGDCEHDRDVEAHLLTCRRCRDRMASALRQIPRLLADLAAPDWPADARPAGCSEKECTKDAGQVGYLRRNGARGQVRRYCDRHLVKVMTAAEKSGCVWVTIDRLVGWTPADPAAASVPAGPVPQPSKWSRVAGTRPAREPVNLDAVDLTSRVNHDARRLLARGALGLDDDQVGHLSAATILDGWARDWAGRRGEGLPRPAPDVLCGWLGDRLDWACAEHPAVDEFADELSDLYRTLMGVTGWSTPPPETLSVECPSCAMLTLYRDADLERVACGSCPRLMTEQEYAEHCRRLIEEAA